MNVGPTCTLAHDGVSAKAGRPRVDVNSGGFEPRPLTRNAPSTAAGRAEVNPMRLVREPSYDTE